MKKSQSKGIGWRGLFVLASLLMAGILELGKHTLLGCPYGRPTPGRRAG